MELPEDLVEEILLRVPPSEPAFLFRAALACKPWNRLIASPGFRRRFRDSHGPPPMLGFPCNFMADDGYVAHFVPALAPAAASSRLPHRAPAPHGGWWRVSGVCHGRVLLHGSALAERRSPFEKPLVLWDPITDQRRELPLPPPPSVQRTSALRSQTWNAAVLCAVAAAGDACDRLDCHGEHFLVVLLVTYGNDGMLTCVYSSEAGAWGDPATYVFNHHGGVSSDPSVRVGNSLYFLNLDHSFILQYDLGSQRMSVIRLPVAHQKCILLTTADGRPGFTTVMMNFELFMFSREVSHVENGGWELSTSVDLKDLLPDIDRSALSYTIGTADSIGVIFLFAHMGIFAIDLNSSRIMEICKASSWPVDVFPYFSF